MLKSYLPQHRPTRRILRSVICLSKLNLSQRKMQSWLIDADGRVRTPRSGEFMLSWQRENRLAPSSTKLIEVVFWEEAGLLAIPSRSWRIVRCPIQLEPSSILYSACEDVCELNQVKLSIVRLRPESRI